MSRWRGWYIPQSARTDRRSRWQLPVGKAVVIADITYFIALFKILLATRQFEFLLKGGVFCSVSLGVAIALFVSLCTSGEFLTD